MFRNKNKGVTGLPDLPKSPRAIPSMKDYDRSIPSYPEDEESDKEIHSLPSFPDSPMRKGFSQSAIKAAVSPEEQEKYLPHEAHSAPAFPEEAEEPIGSPPSHKTIEMEEWKPSNPEPAPLPSSPGFSSIATPIPTSVPTRLDGNKPVFIKLEKFKDARESLDKVKISLNEVEDLLRQTREIKIREDHELAAWEKEMENIKARINSVNQQIFENPQS